MRPAAAELLMGPSNQDRIPVATADDSQQAKREQPGGGHQQVDDQQHVARPRHGMLFGPKEEGNSDARQARVNPGDTRLSARIPLPRGAGGVPGGDRGRGAPCQSGDTKQFWEGGWGRPHDNVNALRPLSWTRGDGDNGKFNLITQ